jgi:hypothetical protein
MQTNKLLALKMTENHAFPITPPPELVQQWTSLSNEMEGNEVWMQMAIFAAQWGADQELEACCEWADETGWVGAGDCLRSLRRQPSLKKQAMRVLLEAGYTLDGRMELEPEDIDIIHRALEQLDGGCVLNRSMI